MPHTIDIYRYSNKYVTIKPDDNSSQVKQVMGNNLISLSFELSYEAKFRINDWCTVFGEKYVLVDNPPPVTKGGKYEYRYTLTMKSEASELEKAKFLFLGNDNLLREPEFSLMGNAETFISLLINNTNRFLDDLENFGTPGITYTRWTAGEILPTDYKNLTFSHDTCLSALSKVAEAFGTEWWVIGKKIILAKKINDTGTTLKHGRQKGLYEITRQAANNARIITSVFPYGAKTNIPFDYGSERLRVSGLGFNHVMANNVALDRYGIIEDTPVFEDIYPHRTGKVTSVDATNFYKFTDSTIDFNLNDYLMPGMSAKVVFNTGELAGYQFEISNYNNATKTVTFLKNKDETSIDVPSTSLKPQIGDEYVFVDIKLPAEYVTAAENKLFTAAIEYLNRVSEPQYSFSIVVDPTFVRNRGLSFEIGDMIWITDADLEIDRKIRLTETNRKIVDEDQYTLTLSDTVAQRAIESIQIQSIQNNVSSAQQGVRQINSQLENGLLFNGRMSIPETTDVTGMSPLYIDNNTDKIYKKV